MMFDVPGGKLYRLTELQDLPVDGGGVAAGELRAATGRAGDGRGETEEGRESSALLGEKREEEEQHCCELSRAVRGLYTNITAVTDQIGK